MSKTQVNSVAGECAVCKVEVPAEAGVRRYNYTDTVIECADCAAVRLKREAVQREVREHEGQVLYTLLPALSELAALTAVQMGDTYGTTHADVDYRGDTYRVTVQRVEE